MHYFIYEAYYKYFKRDLFNRIKSMPKVIKIFFFAWLALFLLPLIVMLIMPTRITFAFYAIISTVATILLCGVAKIYNHKTLDTRMVEREDRLGELDAWLKNYAGIKDKNGIKQLRNKMQIEINERHKSIEKVESIIFKLFELICIPVILAVFTRFLQLSDTDFSENAITGIVMLTMGLLILVSILFAVYTVITEVIRNSQRNYEMFAEDLQDILDTRYEIKPEDILQVN